MTYELLQLSLNDKFEGCLYGQAIGDALGLGSEFMTRSEVKKNYPDGLSDYNQIVQDSHRCRWHKGDWTDDTDMMLCIACALIKHGGKVDNTTLKDIAQNFKNWAFSPECMDIGALVSNVLSIADYVEKPMDVAKVFWILSNKKNAPNGGLMRTSVVGLLRDDVASSAERICELTHYDPRCVGSCVIVSEIIHNLVYKDVVMNLGQIKSIAEKYDERIAPYIDLAWNSADIGLLELDEQYSAGYTLKTLAAALWCYFHSKNFVDGLHVVINAGGDADTNAAVACSILGAKYGASSIPAYYKENLWKSEEYEEIVKQLENTLI